ncbi:MAG: thiosulfate oxidation carrier complex protein SoxZ [Gammaproteobacteria bacterium]|nr:thiosulfate oxidation carrier complex protein SoxZ [Gammaproteobacteria bacterium]
MAQNTIKIKAEKKEDFVEVRTMIQHPMETGLSIDPETKTKIPAHFIQEVKCELNGKVVLVANMNMTVSKNPYLSFRLNKGDKGDTLKISWVDNLGERDSAAIKIK